jgi:hypothetical protein
MKFSWVTFFCYVNFPKVSRVGMRITAMAWVHSLPSQKNLITRLGRSSRSEVSLHTDLRWESCHWNIVTESVCLNMSNLYGRCPSIPMWDASCTSDSLWPMKWIHAFQTKSGGPQLDLPPNGWDQSCFTLGIIITIIVIVFFSVTQALSVHQSNRPTSSTSNPHSCR